MFVQIVLLIFNFVMIENTRAPTHLLVTRVGPCYEPLETIIKVSELSITTQTYDSKLSGVINIPEDISNGWKIKATMLKCVDIRNIDSCDFFKSFFVVNNGCSTEKSEKNLYSTLFNFTNPKMKCPVQAGIYELQNYPFNSEDNYVSVFESKISTSVFGFTFRLDGYTHDRKQATFYATAKKESYVFTVIESTGAKPRIFCLETYLQLLYKRNHDWVKITNERMTTSPPTTQQISFENEDY